MDWEKIIFYGLVGIAVSFAMNYLNKGANQNVEKRKNGDIELGMNRLYQTLGLAGVGSAVVFIAVALFIHEKEVYIISTLMVLLFGGLGVPCLMYYKNHKVTFNDKTISVQNWKGKTNNITWTEINRIKFNPFSGYLKIYGLDKKLTIHQHLVGLKEFVKKMEEKTKWKANELKLPFK